MSALIVDPEHINVLIWARPVRCLTVGRALRANWPPPAAIWPVAPHRFSRQQGCQAYTAGTPSPATCTAAGSPVSARASPGGSAPAAPCGSNGVSALWKRAKGAGAPGAPGRKSASSFSASFQMTAPPHDGPQTRADRRTTHDRTKKHNDTSRRPVGQHRPRPEQQY